MLKKTLRLFYVFCLIVFITSTPAWAAKGLRIGTGMGLAFPAFRGDAVRDITPSPGLAWDIIELGYGFTNTWSVNLKLMGAAGKADADDLENEMGGHVDTDFTWAFAEYGLDVRYAFMPDSKQTPYLLAGVGLISGMTIEGEVEKTDVSVTTDPAVGFDVGAGFDYYLGAKKRWSVGSQIYYHMVQYNSAKVDVEHDASKWDDENIKGGIVLWTATLSYTFRK